MDVERLMRDLTVQQLEEIHKSLQSEMEQRKDELREMVGRRYRDVLDASSEVQKVLSQAETVVEYVGKARSTQAPLDSRPPASSEKDHILQFMALHTFIPLIGTDCDDADALSDAFSLLIVESLHRQLSVDSFSTQMSNVINSLTPRLLRTRRELIAQLRRELGELSTADWAAVQLAALAILQSLSLEQLLNIYLEERKTFISQLISGGTTLLNILTEIKATLQVVQSLFVQGDLVSIIQSISSTGYVPPVLEVVVADQTLSFKGLLTNEVNKVHNLVRERQLTSILTHKITEKCTQWTDEVSSKSHESVAAVCAYHEKSEDVLGFLVALSAVLTENWPRIGSSLAVYQNLFQTTVVEKFKALVSSEVASAESSFSSSVQDIPIASPSLFENRTSSHFDPKLAAGYSPELRDCVMKLLSELSTIRELCLKYEKIGMEPEAASLRHYFADTVLQMITRICQLGNDTCGVLKGRMCLALLQADPTTQCQLLNKDSERISKCSQMLKNAVEDSFFSQVSDVIGEFLSVSHLHYYTCALSDTMESLQLCSEWEKVNLAEVGVVEVPVCLSAPLSSALFDLARRVATDSLPLLLSRPVKKRINEAVAEHINQVFSVVVGEGKELNLPQRSLLQLLFDLRVLNSHFPCTGNGSLIEVVQSKIDPLDLSLISPYMQTNTKLAANRTQLMWACLLPDVLPSRELTLSQSYLQLTDILTRPAEHPPRIPLIPRLDRTIGEDGLRRMQSRRGRGNNLLKASSQHAQQKGSGAALSDLYNKFTGSWFGGN